MICKVCSKDINDNWMYCSNCCNEIVKNIKFVLAQIQQIVIEKEKVLEKLKNEGKKNDK